ncbi:MAG: glycosyltransferase family protein [Acidimicrobiales bacterium]
MSAIRPLSKVLLYSHDTYGMGHLRRNLVIARQLLADPATRVVLASGSPVLDRVARPARLVCVQLPPVVKTGVDQYRSIDTNVSVSLVSRARSAVLSDVATRWQPDVLLVDHAPQGMKGELLPVFETLRSRCAQTKVVLGLRDILDDPSRVQATWEAQGIYDTLDAVYDQVVVYGDRDVFDLVPAYRIPEPLASRIEYCGYVVGDRPERALRPAGLSAGGEYVLGTVGGGGDGVEVLIAVAHAATAAGLEAVLCTGPLMSGADRRRLGAVTDGRSGMVVVEHLDDLAAVACGARCVVTRGGYNSLCELINLGVPTVVVPRVWPRREQLLRARAFATRGLVHLVDAPDETLVPVLARAMAAAMGSPGGIRHELALTGAPRVVRSLARTVADPAGARLGGRDELPRRISA